MPYGGRQKVMKVRDSFLAILEAARFVKEHLSIEFEIDSKQVKCEFHILNKECRKTDCRFYPLK